jgi:glycosyltransferase involved in cell wall biosynthesis
VKQDAASSGRTIVLAAPRFHTNQVGLVKALLARGHRVVFHSLLHGNTEDHSVVAPLIIPEGRASKIVHRLSGEGGVNRPRAFPSPLAYYNELKREQADVLIVRGPTRAFSLVAAACARLLGVRVVFYSQDHLRRRYSAARRLATWLLLRLFCAAWYTPLLGAARSGHPPKGRYFVPFVVESDAAGRKRLERPTILMVGKYNPRKNHLLLIEALAPIMAQREIDIVIIGECATPEQAELRGAVEKRVTELGLEDRITLVENLPYPRMPEFYRSAHLFVLPASDEPAAISVLEAIAFGVPAICSDSCGTRFYIEEGVTGGVFRSESLTDLERVLREWLEDEPRLREASTRCKEAAASAFSGDAFYERFKAMMSDRWPAEAGRW